MAAAYDDVRPVDDNWREVFELVVAEAELRGARVLDAGCGTGRLAAALADSGIARVWGVDRSP
jgi:predicted RNA methylase